jgi:hypothetical protein
MQILAGSLNVEVPGLLHAGYLSAYPRTFIDQGSYLIENATPEVIDVAAALALKEHGNAGERAAESATVAPAAESGPLWHPAKVDGVASLGVAFVMFAYLFALYFRKMLKWKWLGWIPWASALVALILMVYAGGAIYRAQVAWANHAPCPWKDVAVQAYQDPESATKAILHGLIVNGLAGLPFHAENLSAIQNQVAFPLPGGSWTPGMVYAQKTYGRDGWGRDFNFGFVDGKYRITSAGADGVLGTTDDIGTDVCDVTGSWEERISSVYVRPAEGQPICLLHNVGDGTFRAVDKAAARHLTESELFDTFRLDQMIRPGQGEKSPRGIGQLKSHTELFDFPAGKDRLFLVRFSRYDDGQYSGQ